MPTLTINGTSFTGFPQGFSGSLTTLVAGAYYSTDRKTGQPPMIGYQEKGYEDVNFEGVSGTGRIEHFPFLGRNITGCLIFAGALATVEAAHKTFFDSAVQTARYTITMPGTTALQGCVLRSVSDEWFENVDRNAIIFSHCVFRQLSTTN